MKSNELIEIDPVEILSARVRELNERLQAKEKELAELPAKIRSEISKEPGVENAIRWNEQSQELNELEDGIKLLLNLRTKRGEPGIPGRDGVDGKDGRDGIDGRNGDMGPQGPKGLDGKDGLDGRSISAGSGLPPFMGAESDLYVDAATGDLYEMDGGAWVVIGNLKGPKGDAGPRGKDGKRGAKWYQGAGAPKDVKGAVVGDFYLDTAAGDVWELGTSWVLRGNIKGPMGVPGRPGPPGPPGSGGGGTWGSITGTLSSQTDLQSALDAKIGTALTSAQILVGSSTNVATARTISGDGTISNTGVFAIGANKVTSAMVRQSVGLSVIGRSANSTGNIADIVAAADGDVLRRSGTSIGFGSIPSTSVSLTAKAVGYGSAAGRVDGNVNKLSFDDILNRLGIGLPPTSVAAALHVLSNTAETATPPGSLTVTAVLESTFSPPNSSDISVTPITTDIPQDLQFVSFSQNTGTGVHVCNGQTINYQMLCTYLHTDSKTYQTALVFGSFTDSINDGTTTFSVDITVSVSSGIVQSYFVQSDGGGVFTPYSYDVGTNTSFSDLGGSFNVGFGASFPTGLALFVSTGGTISNRARFYGLSPTGLAYFGQPYDISTSEPTTGANYLIEYTTGASWSQLGISQLWFYGANDNSSSYTYAWVAPNSQTVTAGFGSWGSPPLDTTPDQSPTSYANITGSGQTYTYKARTRILIDAFNYYYSSTETAPQAVTVPNTGLKYYIEITSATAGSSTTVLGGSNQGAYRVYKASPSSYTQSQLTAPFTSFVPVSIVDNNDFTSGVEATPISYFAPTSRFEGVTPADPTAPNSGADLNVLFKATNGLGVAGAWFVTAGGTRVFGLWGGPSTASIAFVSNFNIRTIAGTTYLSASPTGGFEFSTTSQNVPVIFRGTTSTPELLYISQTALQVTVGATSGAGFFNIIQPSSKTVNPVFYAKTLGAQTGDLIQFVDSGSVQRIRLTADGTWMTGRSSAAGTGTVTIDWAQGNVKIFTFGAGNATLSYTNVPGSTVMGAVVVLNVIQDSVGSRTVAWPGVTKWVGGVAPTLTTTANARDVFTFWCDGTNLYEMARALNVK